MCATSLNQMWDQRIGPAVARRCGWIAPERRDAASVQVLVARAVGSSQGNSTRRTGSPSRRMANLRATTITAFKVRPVGQVPAGVWRFGPTEQLIPLRRSANRGRRRRSDGVYVADAWFHRIKSLIRAAIS
jgi:hypothetical protein